MKTFKADSTDIQLIENLLKSGEVWDFSKIQMKKDIKSESKTNDIKTSSKEINDIITYSHQIVSKGINFLPLFESDVLPAGYISSNSFNSLINSTIPKGEGAEIIQPRPAILFNRYIQYLIQYFFIRDIYFNVDKFIWDGLINDIFDDPSYADYSSPNHPALERLRITAAFANSIYYEILNNSPAIHNSPDYSGKQDVKGVSSSLFCNSQFMLVKCRITGIKEFVYYGNENTSINELKNKSSYFKFLTSVIKNYCLHYFNLTTANVLFYNDECFSLLLPFSFTGKLTECKVYINSTLAEAFKGNISLSISSEDFSAGEMGNIRCKWMNILKKQNDDISNQFQDIDYKNIFRSFSDSIHNSSYFNPGLYSIDNDDTIGQINWFNIEWKNVNPKLKRKYRDCLSVLKSFGVKPVSINRKKPADKFISNSNDNFSDHLTLKQSIPAGKAFMEIILSNPDNGFKTINQDMDLFSFISFYKTYKSILYNSLIADHNPITEDKEIQIINNSDTNLILLGKAEKLINIPITINRTIKKYYERVFKIPVFINMIIPDGSLSVADALQISQKYLNGATVKKQYSNKVILFGEKFNWKEFGKIIELIDLFVNLLTSGNLDERSKSILLKGIYKSSILFNRLMKSSSDGYLYFDEILRFRYGISSLEGITDEQKSALVKTYEDILTASLVGNINITNRMILPAACKIAGIITRSKQYKPSPSS